MKVCRAMLVRGVTRKYYLCAKSVLKGQGINRVHTSVKSRQTQIEAMKLVCDLGSNLRYQLRS